MANGPTSGLESLLGIDTTAGNSQVQQALAAIQGVRAPTAQQLTLPELQQYVQQGVLTPEQYQAMLADPQIYSQVLSATQDNSGTAAQKQALQQLGGIIQAGGSTPINQANLINNINMTNQAMQAARSAIMQNAQERGVAGNGLEFMKQLADEQSNAQTANTTAGNAAANNAQLALQALTQQETIGGTMQGQANQSAQAQAQAAQQIAQYNSQLQSAANQYNTQTANQAQASNLAARQSVADQNTTNANNRTMYNTQLPQTVFQDQMQQANAEATQYNNQANLAEKQAEQQAGFTGSLIGAGAQAAGSYYGAGGAGSPSSSGSTGLPAGADVSSADYQANAYNNSPIRDTSSFYSHGGMVKCYAQGGEVHDHSLCMKVGGRVPGQAQVPGDSTQNDTVKAHLSPGEVVIPRSVANSPNAPQKAAQFVAQTKGMGGAPIQPKVNSFADALKMLEDNGLELRLHTRD